MGWERRQRGGRRYVQKKRIGGKAVSHYIGAGELGHLAATLDKHTRQEKEQEQAKWRQERDALQAADKRLALYCEQVEALFRKEMETAGYHRHKRGPWRKERMSNKALEKKKPSERDLMRRAGEGDSKAADAFYAQIAERIPLEDAYSLGNQSFVSCDGRVLSTLEIGYNPSQSTKLDLTEYYASLARWYTDLIESRIPKDKIFQRALYHSLKKKRNELGYETASPLERLLIERVVACWFHLHDLETQYNRALQNSLPLEQFSVYQQCLDRAQKRYLSAIHSLALVRRLELPAVQVNIAEKQVNILQSGASPMEALPPLEADTAVTIDVPATAEAQTEGALEATILQKCAT